jgi:hypothetical protein
VADAVVEDNRIENSDRGLVVEPGAVRVLVRNNRVAP